jgi:acyl-coenzyme A thioesterase PaaI-like protein
VSTPINIGRTLQVWKTEIFREDGKLAAVVTQTQIVKPASA